MKTRNTEKREKPLITELFFKKLTSLKKYLKEASPHISPIVKDKKGTMDEPNEKIIREKVGNHISFYFHIIEKILNKRKMGQIKRELYELMINCKTIMGQYPFVLQVIEALFNRIKIIFLMRSPERRLHLLGLASHLEIWSMKLWYQRDTNNTEEYRGIMEMTKIINPDMPVLWEIVKDMTFLLIVLEIGK